jgi:hypothetical protein
MIERPNSMEELIQMAENSRFKLEGLGVRAESRPGQFPYRFSYCCGDDRYDAEIAEEEVQLLSGDGFSAEGIQSAFSRAIARTRPRAAIYAFR